MYRATATAHRIFFCGHESFIKREPRRGRVLVERRESSGTGGRRSRKRLADPPFIRFPEPGRGQLRCRPRFGNRRSGRTPTLQPPRSSNRDSLPRSTQVHHGLEHARAAPG